MLTANAGMPQLMGPLPTYLQQIAGPLPEYLGKVGFNPKLLGGVTNYVNVGMPELGSLAAGLAVSFASIFAASRGYTTAAKVTAGLGALSGLFTSYVAAHSAKLAFETHASQDYGAAGLELASGLAMLGASWHGWKRA